MTKNLLFTTGLLLVWLVARAAGPNPEDQVDAKAAYARLGTLAGEWEADTSMGKVHVRYELIAGGSALVERETMEHMPAMETVYHLDGNRLQLTHQPINHHAATDEQKTQRRHEQPPVIHSGRMVHYRDDFIRRHNNSVRQTPGVR